MTTMDLALRRRFFAEDIEATCAVKTQALVDALALEVDEALATRARANLASYGCVELRHGDASGVFGEEFDAVLSSAGVTHPPAGWLDALSPGGRMVLPLTIAFDASAPAALALGTQAKTIGRGLVVAITRSADSASWPVRVVSPVAIYSALGIRDADMNARLAEAFKKTPFPRLSRLRRDTHEQQPPCWLHGDGWCLAMD